MQQVNLLTEELRPKAEPLTGTHLLLAWGAFAVLLLLFTAWQGMSRVWLEDDLETVRLEVGGIAARNAELSSSAERSVASLVTELEHLRAQQVERAELVALLNNHATQKGFAEHLRSLARARVDGLWLNEIHFDQTTSPDGPTVQIKGAASHPQRVPDYLNNIADDQHFAGQRFDHFLLDVVEDRVEFQLVGSNRGTSRETLKESGRDVASAGPG